MSTNLYADKTEHYFGAQRPEMLRLIPRTARSVLEIGCGDGSFAAGLKQIRPVHVTAIEPFPRAAAVARSRVDVLLETGAEEGLRALAGQAFDCIVCNDVLEHLVDPESVLVAAAQLLAADGVVVASLPNVRYMPVLRALVLRGEWRYTNEGVLDRTHLRFFTQKSIREMFVATGYRLQRLEGINSRPLSWKYRVLNLISLNALEDTRHPQFALVATLR